MNKTVYLDNSATTKPCETAIERINISLRENWANPSSLHTLGLNAEQEMNITRKAVAKFLSCRQDEIYFTSGGTEANNIAIFGAVNARKRRGNRIVTTAIEHPSVLETIVSLEKMGYDVEYLHPDKNGIISKEAIENAVNKDTILVSMMLVNNETGAIQPVKWAADAIKKADAPALLHCDAVQAFGKITVKPSSIGADLLTFSGHKVHGPKGIGVLFKAKNVKINSTVYGGNQESGIRSGTESTPLISGLYGALEEIDINTHFTEMTDIWNYANNSLLGTGYVIINSPENALPYILNISIGGYRSETMLHFLESRNIFVSSGSACGRGRGSHVLRAMGLSVSLIDSALRISFSRYNTKMDVDLLVKAIQEGVSTLKPSK